MSLYEQIYGQIILLQETRRRNENNTLSLIDRALEIYAYINLAIFFSFVSFFMHKGAIFLKFV